MARVFDEQDVRDFVGTLDQPALATRGATVVAVNDLWLRLFGFERDEVVGQPFSNFVAPEERERIVRRAQLPLEELTLGPPLPILALAAGDRPVPVRALVSRLAAGGERFFRLTIVVPDLPTAREVNYARDLLTLSAELIGAASEDAVRQRTREGLAVAGLSGHFWSPSHPDDASDRVDVATARSALEARRPIFAGPRSTMPEAVYLPLDDGEVLVVSGHDLDARQSYTLGFFAKLLSTALADARAAEAARRKLEGTQLLLQVAHSTSETLDLDAVLSVTAESLARLLDVSNCFILLYDEERKMLRGNASSTGRRTVVTEIAISIDDPDSISATAARDRRMLVISDTTKDTLAKRATRVHAFHEAAVVAVPIVTRGRLEGVVMLDDTRGPREFGPEWLALASAIVAQVGLPISNARLYESLRRSYAELETTRAEMVKRERLAALGELAAIVAHEVRNPLGVIFNATSSLGRIVAATPEAATLLRIIREECERLNQIVGDLIDFARPRQLSTRPEDVVHVLGEVVESLAVESGVRFEINAPADLPLPVVDRRLLRQALLNVTENARQATPAGGVVRLAASTNAARDEIVLRVSDDGPGIEPRVLERIFEPFFTTKAKGAGLGLAVVKRIVEDHGGRVEVVSSSRGTTFSLHLPLARTVAATAP